MNLISEKLEIINEILLGDARGINNIGLLNGKLGISIFFFRLAIQTGGDEQRKFAETLIDDVYRQVSHSQTSPDFENGLAGIAWGIEYLVQCNFVEADTDEILSDLDNKIYRHLVTVRDFSTDILQGVLGYIEYILSRIEGKDIHDGSLDNYIFKQLLIELINQLGDNIENRKLKIEEPLSFDITWDLPVCLIILSKVRALNIYNAKIDRIIDHLGPLVLSLYPNLSSNRLFLLYSIEFLLIDNIMDNWRKHADLLKKNLKISQILNEDFKDKNLYLLNGIAGISLVARRLYKITKDEKFLFKHEELIRRIITSEVWQNLNENELIRKKIGLLFGHAGLGLELLQMNKNSILLDSYDFLLRKSL